MGNRKNSTGWFVAALIVTAFILIAFAGFCIYIDPFLHYHKPLDGYAYHTVENEPYMNDGIIRQYDFSGVITGSSMTENFKTSEAEQLFGGRFIKIPLNGASFYEHSNQLDRVYSKGKTPSVVIRALDPDGLVVSKDYSRHDYSDIEFIFNDNPFDDVNYIFNLHLFTVHTLALLGNSQPKEMPSMDFDKYCTWEYDTGVDAVLLQDASLPPVDAEELFTDDHKEILLANIRQNVTNMADEHPETTFYCFFSPYSIYYWDSLNSSAKIRWLLEAERTAAEEILGHPNIKLFMFSSNYDLTCNLDNYKDMRHYSSKVNSQILKWMSDGEYMLTSDNFQNCYDEVERFYTSYDYSALKHLGD